MHFVKAQSINMQIPRQPFYTITGGESQKVKTEIYHVTMISKLSSLQCKKKSRIAGPVTIVNIYKVIHLLRFTT